MNAYMKKLLDDLKSQQAIDHTKINNLQASVKEMTAVCDDRDQAIKLVEAAMKDDSMDLTLKEILK